MQLFSTDCGVSTEVQLLLDMGRLGDLGNRVIRSSDRKKRPFVVSSMLSLRWIKENVMKDRELQMILLRRDSRGTLLVLGG